MTDRIHNAADLRNNIGTQVSLEEYAAGRIAQDERNKALANLGHAEAAKRAKLHPEIAPPDPQSMTGTEKYWSERVLAAEATSIELQKMADSWSARAQASEAELHAMRQIVSDHSLLQARVAAAEAQAAKLRLRIKGMLKMCDDDGAVSQRRCDALLAIATGARDAELEAIP